MRQEEICRLLWEDIDAENRTIVVRDRKDPRFKSGNHQRVPLLDKTGFDAWAILAEQKACTSRSSRVFPYNSKSVSAAFTTACHDLKIKDLRFHDLRHEATTRLFEAGFGIEQVALVTGHKDWKMLKRYTNLRPEQLHHHLMPTGRSTRPMGRRFANRPSAQPTDIAAHAITTGASAGLVSTTALPKTSVATG